ncbi:MAG: GDSL-type esterase/lipase family protein [Magnetococcus sp. MYC-9]
MGKIFRKILIILTALLLHSPQGWAEDGWADRTEIDWEVLNRFQLIKGSPEEKRYREDLGKIKGIIARRDKRYSGFTERLHDTYWDADEHTYDSFYLSPKRERHLLFHAHLPGEVGKARCLWNVEGYDTPSSGVIDCTKAYLAHLPTGFHKVTVEVQPDHSALPPFTKEKMIEVKDRVVVVLGDSYASGEGTPDRQHKRFAEVQWHDKRCHRSLFSGFNQAVFAMTGQDRHHATILLNFACSGAEVEKGLLSPYAGVDPPEQAEPLPAQLYAAAALLCNGAYDRQTHTCSGEPRPADVVVLSAGGNDIGFADTVKRLLLRSYTDEGCVERLIVPPGGFTERNERLLQSYARLRKELQGQLAPRQVLVMEYPDPTHHQPDRFGEVGLLCRNRTVNTGLRIVANILSMGHSDLTITPQENRCAFRDILTPLNETVHSVSGTPDWRVVEAVAGWESRGVCAPTTNYNWTEYAWEQLDGHGLYHPNMSGQWYYRDALLPALRQAIAALP